jgi:ABC-type Mn2+/Zn2+ transport system ATPase subunit
MTDLLQQITYKGTHHQAEMPALSLQNVSVTYTSIGGDFSPSKQKYALQDVSFQVQAGEQIAVVGPNGAGKSTLFKVIAGILKPNAGTVHMFGQPPAKHICIAYVPQRNQIDWTFPVTVSDVVMMGRTRQIGLFRRPSQHDRDLVARSLERVNALHLANIQIGELSGGQQQRVFIARALALETDLVLFDEPLSGLDVPSQEAIFDILANLRPDGVTVLVATHDLQMAAERFDRVMLLNKRIVALDTGANVLTTENLITAYGGHMHRVDGEILLTDTCCDHDDPI